MMKLSKGVVGGLRALVLLTAVIYFVRAQPAKAEESEAPLGVGYWSAQFPNWPPLPANFYNFQQVEVSPGVFVLNDLEFDYFQASQLEALLNGLESMSESLPLPLPPGCCESGGGSGGGGNAPGGRLFSGNCTGHLLSPVYQVTNVVLTITGATSGDHYDLYSATNLNQTHWSYLGRWTNAAANWIISNPPTNESYYAVGCVDDRDVSSSTNAPPEVADGLPDVYEVLVSHTNERDPDTDYDGRSDYEEDQLDQPNSPLDATEFRPLRLAHFRFNEAALSGDRGQLPMATNNLQAVDAWITKGVQSTNSAAQLKYKTVESDGTANINLRSGTVRFWFKPLWTSGNETGSAARLLEVGQPNSNGWWVLFFDSYGTNLVFASQTNGASAATNLTASVSFVSNNWYQIALTFTNGAFTLYTNGVLCATNTGTLAYPGLLVRTNGFTLGSDASGANQARGIFEDLEMFNYPLNGNDILESFQFTQPPMLIPNLKFWLMSEISQVLFGSSNRVDTWYDQSPNAHNAFQTAVGSRPLFITNWIADKSSVYFPGTNYFRLPDYTFTNLSAGEIFIVLKAATNTPLNPSSLWNFGAIGESYYPASNGTIADGFGGGTGNTGTPTQPLDQPHLYNVTVKSNEWTSRINGVIHFSKNSQTVRFNTNFGFSVWLGRSSANFAGHIAEVLMYGRALKGIEREAVNSYLSQRFGLVTNTPAVPTNLVVFAVSSSQVSLVWDYPLSTTNTSFTIQRRSANGEFTNVATVQNSLSFLDGGLIAGATNYYRIRAARFSGLTAYSDEWSVIMPGGGADIPLSALKVWLKADSGYGGTPMNCWVDASTNNFTAYHPQSQNPLFPITQPRWSVNDLNERPAVVFDWTNGFNLPKYSTGWTQGEVYVVLKTLGPSSTKQNALWLMGDGSLSSAYPFTNGNILENFGRRTNVVERSVPGGFQFSTPHLYNVASQDGAWGSWLNNANLYTTSTNKAGFNDTPLIGLGSTPSYFRGSIAELLIFDRVLTLAERDCVATNYLRRRFNLW